MFSHTHREASAHREHHTSHQQSAQQHNHNMNHSSRPKDYMKASTGSSDDEQPESSSVSRFFFGLFWCFAQVCLWGSVLMLLYWFLRFDRGFAWQNDRGKMFNLHAFL